MPVVVGRLQPQDDAGLAVLYRGAFPNEDLMPLVHDLVALDNGVLSLAVRDGEQIIAHAVFTDCGIEGRRELVGLLGPLAVSPSWQRQGIGSALVKEGLAAMATRGAVAVLVLGDPAYYRRHGFVPCDALVPPFALPDGWGEAWQAVWLSLATPRPSGRLRLPEPWLKPALWAP